MYIRRVWLRVFGSIRRMSRPRAALGALTVVSLQYVLYAHISSLSQVCLQIVMLIPTHRQG